MTLAEIAFTFLALLGAASPAQDPQSPAPVQSDRPRSADATDSRPSEVEHNRKVDFYPATSGSGDEFVRALKSSGLVNVRDGDPPRSNSSLLLRPGNLDRLEPVWAALKAIVEMEQPRVTLQVTNFEIKSVDPTPGSAAQFTFDWSTPPEQAQRMVDAFETAGVKTFASVRPRASLWLLKPSFAALSNPGFDEQIEQVRTTFGLSSKPGEERLDSIIPQGVALIYGREHAGRLLQWMRESQMVLEVVPAAVESSSLVIRPVEVLTPEDRKELAYAKLTGQWSWSCSVGKANRLAIRRVYGVAEHWHGESEPRKPSPELTSEFACQVSPGKVAMLNALAVPGDVGFQPHYYSQDMGKTYFPLLVVETREVNGLPLGASLDDGQPAALFKPDGATPLEQVRPTGYGSRSRSSGPLALTAVAEERLNIRLPVQVADPSLGPPKLQSSPANSQKLVIAGDGGATSDADKEKIKKLISEGVLKQVDALAYAPDVADLMFQPKLNVRSGGGGLELELSTTPVDPKWDDALRQLSKQPLGIEVRVKFFEPDAPFASVFGFVPNADARVYVPVDSTHKVSETIISAFEKVGLTVNVQQNHPFFGAQSIPKGKELYAVYANEAGSPTAIVQSTDDLVDVRLILEEGSGLRGTFGRTPTLLARASIHTYQNAPKDTGGRRVVGVLVTPEEARLLRLAERAGRLEAFRRDPGDSTPLVDTAPLAAALLADAGENPRGGSFTASAVPNLKVIRLLNAQAGPMSSLLTQVVRREGFTAVADERTNSLVVTSPDEETFLVAEALLAKLDEDTQARGVANPLAALAGGRVAPAAKPLVELQQTYAQAEAAAATQARQLREFIAKRPVALRDKRFAEQQQQHRERLAKAVNDAFAARQSMLAAELAELQRRVEAAQRSLELRNRAADEIVARRVEDLLNPELKWDDPQVAGEMAPAARPPASSPLTLPGPPMLPGAARSPVVPSGPGTKRPSAAGSSGAGRTPRTIPLGRLSLDEADRLLSQVKQVITDLDDGAITSSSNGSQLQIRCTDRELEDLQPFIDMAKYAANDRGKQTELQLLTGIWESQNGLGGGMGMGMGGYGESMDGMSGDPPPRLVIDGDCAALYVKNERQRLWTITVDQAGQTSSRVTFTPLDDQPGMEGSFNVRERSLTVVGTGAEGAKIERYTRSIAAVPPDWSKQMQDAAREKRPAAPSGPRANDPNAPEGFAPRSRVDLSTTAPATPLETLSKLTGLWATAGQGGGMGGMGMDMGTEGPFPVGPGGMPIRPQTYLAISGDRAALYEKNERKQAWSISVIEADASQIRLEFAAAEGQPGMQGIYTSKADTLSVVSTGELGATIVQYHRVVAVVPPEWAKEMGGQRSAEPLRGISSGTLRVRTEDASAADPSARPLRQPSDYLPLLEKYRTTHGEYEVLLQTIGADHPRARKFRNERSHELDAIDVLKSEFELDVDEALRRRSLMREQAVQAEERLMYTRRQVEKGTASQTLMEQERLARDAAKAELESAEKRVKLFEASRLKLFPPRDNSGSVPTYAPPSTGSASPFGPASPTRASESEVPLLAPQPLVGEKPSEPIPPAQPPQAATPAATP